MNVLAVDPRTRGVVYASFSFSGSVELGPAGARGTVFKSTTGGSFWSPIDVPFSVQALVIDPRTPAILYAGAISASGGVFKSTNGGASWNASHTGIPSGVSTLAIDPETPTTLYAGAFDVFKSTDGGATWSATNAGFPSGVKDLAIDPLTPATVYATTELDGIFKTTNGGATWSESNTGLFLVRTTVSAFAVAPKTPNVLYVSLTRQGIFKSTDGGASWEPSQGDFAGLEAQDFAIDPQTPATVYAATDLGVFKSTDAGASWSPSNTGITTEQIARLAIDPQAPATLYAATVDGLFKSTDSGASWNPSNTAVTATSLGALAIDPTTPATLYAGTDFGGGAVFRSTNGGASWGAKTKLGFSVGALAVDPKTPATVYAGIESPGGLFKSTDRGTTWSASSAGLVSGGVEVSVRILAVDPQAPATLYAGAGTFFDGVFKSTNGGVSWNTSNTGLPINRPRGDLVQALAIDPLTPATLYAGTLFNGVFKSTNGGSSWSAVNAGLTALAVYALAIDPQTPATLYAGTEGGGVFKSTNGAAGWSPSNAGLSDDFVQALAVTPQAPATLYAGTERGRVFKSTNAGASWSDFNIGLPDRGVRALAINPSGTCVHAATSGGVFDFATQLSAECPPPPALAAAFSTTSQSVAVGGAAQVRATVQNLSGTAADRRLVRAARPPGDESLPVLAEKCGITQLTGARTSFTFQAIDPATGQPVADVNAPVDIGPGSSQTFVMTLTPQDNVCALDIQFGFNCTNTSLADIISGLNTLLLTAGDSTSCGLSAAVSASQSTFTVGQTLIAGGSVTNAGVPDTSADFYVGVLRPDSSIQFVTPTGLVLGHGNDLGSFRPLATNVPLGSTFSVSQSNVFTHQWTADDPRGRYVFFLVAVKTGALAGGSIGNDQILRLATAPYTFP